MKNPPNFFSNKTVTKAIIPVAGLGLRFLPLTKVLTKEFLPLVDKPIVQYLVEEVKKAGIEKIAFVTRPGEKNILKYFKKSLKLIKTLKDKKKEQLLAELKNLEKISKDLIFTSVVQEKPLGDGHAILQAKKLVGKEASAVLFVDDIIVSKIPGILQLLQIFKTCQKPVVALKKLPQEKLSRYGVVGVEKIAHRLYKIKKIIEKPTLEKAPSDLASRLSIGSEGLAIVGRYVLTPEVFEYLQKAKPSGKGEVILAEVLEKMLNDGKIIYGYEIEGEWLECGDKARWLRSNIYLSLKHPQYSPELKKFLKEIK